MPANESQPRPASPAPPSGGPTEANHLLDIRKYPNRRYYDSTRSRHLTLEEIRDAIRDGWEVRVIDSKSGEEITSKVLTQILIELDDVKLGVFPVSMLHRLLRTNRQIIGDFVSRYFNTPLTAFLDSQRNFEHYMRQTMGAIGLPAGGATPSMADWARMMWPGASGMAPGGAPGAARGPAPGMPAAMAPTEPAAAPRPDGDAMAAQLAALAKQVEQLQARLAATAPGATAARAAPAPRRSPAGKRRRAPKPGGR
jgi:polyhydroxyalkanoate synthesis repressor PhaR